MGAKIASVKIFPPRLRSFADSLQRMLPRHRFVLDGLLGVSAAHLNLLTESTETAQLALYYRSQAMSGLQQAVSNFTEENADAVVACSILLTWFQCDW